MQPRCRWSGSLPLSTSTKISLRQCHHGLSQLTGRNGQKTPSVLSGWGCRGDGEGDSVPHVKESKIPNREGIIPFSMSPGLFPKLGRRGWDLVELALCWYVGFRGAYSKRVSLLKLLTVSRIIEEERSGSQWLSISLATFCPHDPVLGILGQQNKTSWFFFKKSTHSFATHSHMRYHWVGYNPEKWLKWEMDYCLAEPNVCLYLLDHYSKLLLTTHCIFL